MKFMVPKCVGVTSALRAIMCSKLNPNQPQFQLPLVAVTTSRLLKETTRLAIGTRMEVREGTSWLAATGLMTWDGLENRGGHRKDGHASATISAENHPF